MLSNQGTKITYSSHRKLILRIKNISLSLYVDLTAYYPEAARTYKQYIYSLNSLITSTCYTNISAIQTVTRLRSFDCSFVHSFIHSFIQPFLFVQLLCLCIMFDFPFNILYNMLLAYTLLCTLYVYSSVMEDK